MNIIGIIPARMASTRLPGKPMEMIAGLPMIGHVYHRSKMAAILDEVYVATDSNKINDVVIELQNAITHFPHVDGTYQEASFGHLMGYAAAYYGYLWSEVYAADMFSLFEENGVLNSEIGYRFRKSIFEKGGGENPMDLVKDFLGREPDNAAFLKTQGISEYSTE